MKSLVVAVLLVALAACAPMSGPRQLDVFFMTNEASLTPDGQKVVTEIAKLAREGKPSRIIVEGQADGGAPSDAALADKRAGAVIDALVAAGVDAGRITKVAAPAPQGVTGVAAHKVAVQLLP
jgi:outer membrane protein OmpA-like peptidoglycan-associated protein